VFLVSENSLNAGLSTKRRGKNNMLFNIIPVLPVLALIISIGVLVSLYIDRKRDKECKRRRALHNRIRELTNKADCDICPSRMKSGIALQELALFFLGEGPYSTSPLGAEQMNTEIVHQIEDAYFGAAEKQKKRWKVKT
jgi:hypothetical protein